MKSAQSFSGSPINESLNSSTISSNEYSSSSFSLIKSSKATKTAYKSQFDVGQRTLLDVLDSEREYNFARTTFESARNSRDFSVYQLLSFMGKMTDSFEPQEIILDREELVDPEVVEAAQPLAIPTASAEDDNAVLIESIK